MSTPGGERSFPGATEAILTVFLYSANNLESAEGVAPSVVVGVAVGGEVRESQEKENSPQPEFLQEFIFMIGRVVQIAILPFKSNLFEMI